MHEISLEGFIESFDRRYPTSILKTLLCDRTTGHNIIWADNEYEALGEGYLGDEEITVEKITGMNSGVIKPRIAKEQEKRSQRTKSRAEVFTPSWLCNQMNNDIDEAWFGRRNAFNTEIVSEDGRNAWSATSEAVEFPKRKGHGWHAYVESPRLEITCGEAPFVCSRYDTVTGDELPVRERVGFLDRKLRVVTEKTKTRKEWVRRALDALRATYGFEYQGDNLIIARINVLETFHEHLHDRWGATANQEEIDQAASIVSWNFWQMDGLRDAIPRLGVSSAEQLALFRIEEIKKRPETVSMFDTEDYVDNSNDSRNQKDATKIDNPTFCKVMDWSNNTKHEFNKLRKGNETMGKKFYAVIGNPPYQETVEGTSDKPIYNYFMDEAYKVSERTELITPARFLFNAGKTPKDWNRKMLDDPHLKVVDYHQKSDAVFPNTDIKGGVVVTYRDEASNLGPIGVFTQFPLLNSILQKVVSISSSYLSSEVYAPESYKFTQAMYADHPEIPSLTMVVKGKTVPLISKGHERDLTSNIFDKLTGRIFVETNPNDNSFIEIVGRYKGERCGMWIDSRYVLGPDNFNKYKVFLPKANGSGSLGEVLSTPLVGQPLVGHTQTFLSIGCFNTPYEADACMKYVKSKFARAMLGVLKVTQDNKRATWSYVPSQNYTPASDIDWSQSVADVDKQLYAKYDLDDEEIDFIESHVKEMD